MLGQQFYHETIRKVIVSFGTIFNDIQLIRKDNSGVIIQSIYVFMGLYRLDLNVVVSWYSVNGHCQSQCFDQLDLKFQSTHHYLISEYLDLEAKECLNNHQTCQHLILPFITNSYLNQQRSLLYHSIQTLSFIYETYQLHFHWAINANKFAFTSFLS